MIAPLRLAQPKPIRSDETPKRPNCPHCGSRLLVAEESHFDFVGRIDHFWACDECGNEFKTSVKVARAAVA